MQKWLCKRIGGLLYAVTLANGIFGACSGASAFFCKNEITDLASAKQYVLGTPRNYDYYVACGFNTISIDGSEVYESLRLGNCDMATSSLDSILSNMYYEVAPYTIAAQEITVNSAIVMNLDTFNNMTADQQALVLEAAEAANQYNAEQVAEMNDEYMAEIGEKTGNEVITLSMDDTKFLYKNELEATYKASVGYAQNLGIADQFKAVVEEQYKTSSLGGDPSELDLTE